MSCYRPANTRVRLCLPVSLLLVVTTLCAGRSGADERVMNAEAFAADADRWRAEQTEDANLKAIFNYRAAAYSWLDKGKLAPAATALRNAGEILQLLGKSAEAKQNYDEALSLTRRTKDPLDAARTHNDLAYLYSLTGDNDQAKQNCQAALAIAQS